MFNRGKVGGLALEVSYEDFDFIDYGGSPSASNITFSGMSLGTPNGNRKIVVTTGLIGSSLLNREVDGVTVAGVAATKVVEVALGNTAGGSLHCAMWIADVPAGATGNVVISVNGTVHSVGAAVHRLVTNNATAVDAGSDGGSVETSRNVTVSASSGKDTAYIAASFVFNSSNPTWTNINKDVAVDIRSGEWQSAASKIGEYGSAQTLTADPVRAIIGASWSLA